VKRFKDFAILLTLAGCGSILYHQPARAGEADRQQQEQQEQQQTEQQKPAEKAEVKQAEVKQADVKQADAKPADSQPAEAPAATTPPTTPADPTPEATIQAQSEAPAAPGKLIVTVGKSLIIDSPLNITRVTIANGTVAEAVAVNPKEVLINGTAPGETSLIVWQQNGTRLVYDLTVRMSNAKLDAVRQQIAKDFPNDDINVTFENDTAFVRGVVKDVTAASRVVAIAATLGKTVNLLNVSVPAVAPQIVLKVRFAAVDRTNSLDLNANLFNSYFNQQLSVGTGSAFFPTPGSGTFLVGSAINLLLFRKDINLAAEIQALQSKKILELLAEPNVLAISGEQASLLAGGEFPFPVVQPSASGTSAISIMWREYGVRLNFLPVVTPRGTIRLKVAPEVSSLDYTNAVTIQGFTIPGPSSRRVQTEVELDSGQTFVIAGLLDNTATDNLSKVPGIGNIPLIGKLFQGKNQTKSNSELLVIITPEVVRPIPEGQPTPELHYPNSFLPTNTTGKLQHPGIDKTGQVPVKPTVTIIPFEELVPKGKEDQQVPMFQPNPKVPPGMQNPNPGSNLNTPPNGGNPIPATPPAGSGGNPK